MGTLLQDLKYGLRMLGKNPGFTAVAVLTLARVIGANTAIFSLVNAVMLRDLPVHDPGRLVLFSDNPGESMNIDSDTIVSGRQREFSYPFYEQVRKGQRVFEDVCAFQAPDDTLTIRAQNQPGTGVQVAYGKLVSGNFFSVLGVRAALGRTLTPADDQPSAPPAAMVSFNFWQQKLGGDRSAVGSTWDIDGVPVTVVGVMPKGFYGVRMRPESADFYMPLSLRPRLPLTVMPQAKALLTDPHIYWLNMKGPLEPGKTLAEAQAAMDVQFRQYLAARAGSKLTSAEQQKIQGAFLVLAPGGRGLSQLRFDYSKPLVILLVIVGLVLLIACANVANLLLVRARARRKEMAMRLALGAKPGRLARQVLTESALLAAAGGVAGALLAAWGVHFLVAKVATRIPLNVRPDTAVLGFSAGVSALAVILAGLAPALRAARVDLVPGLKAAPGLQAGERTRLGLGKSLVVFQIAASLLLMAGAGLLARSLINLENQNLGFSPRHVLLVNINTELAGYDSQRLPGLYRELLSRIGALPNVRSASLGMTSPMSGSVAAFGVAVEGEEPTSHPPPPQVVVVGPHYFETLGIRLAAGRTIGEQDTPGSLHVAVVNQAFVRAFVPRGNPIGMRLSPGPPFKAPGYTIVGVAANARYASAAKPAGPMLFLPAFQLPGIMATANEIEVRASGDPARVTGEVRQAIHSVDANLPIIKVTPLATQVNHALVQQRLISGLVGFFALLGLLLACVGLYGIMAYSVERRTHEIGIRMALGAERANVLRLVVWQGAKLALAGVVLGLAAALALTRLLASLLYGVQPADPATFLAAALLLGAVAALAAYLPARRATKVDPMTALRYE